jgi:hemerythrin-like domain-containing protein
MESRDSIEYIQKEHLEILRLVERLAGGVSLASKEDFSARQKGLAELRALQHGLAGISQHCGEEDSILESDYHHYLDAKQYDRIRTQHKNICRLIALLLRELPYATADSVTELCPQGEDLVTQIREHIAYEEEMLCYVQERQLQIQ